MPPTRLPFDYTSGRPTAEQAVSEDSAAVLLDLEPVFTSLIPDIARAMVRSRALTLFTDVGILNVANPRYGHSLGKLRDILTSAGALQIVLSLDQAEDLAGELGYAAESPPECAHPGCDWLVEKTGHLCAPHEEARS